MNLITRVWKSSLGKKYIMAASGCVLCLFVVGHLLGNLQVFLAPEQINAYAHFLKSKPSLLWAVRLALLVCVGIHAATAVTLTVENRAAQSEPYVGGSTFGSTLASRTMMGSGLVIVAFVLYHLAHFTALLPAVNGIGDFRKLTTVLHGESVPDVYAMMILGFQVWWVVLFYLVAQALLFLHLGHGVAAGFQSVGLRNHTWWPRIARFARLASLLIFLGYVSIPIAIFLHLVGPEYGEKKRYQLQEPAALNYRPARMAGTGRP
jgi:succinate dehydrogenase / fumarate reductase cytochrome b subunit